jgi:hypothetical protein
MTIHGEENEGKNENETLEIEIGEKRELKRKEKTWPKSNHKLKTENRNR